MSPVGYSSYIKRLLDVTGAVILLVSLSWLFLAIIFLYAITLKQPVFFKQQRIGKDEHTFTLFKFRTLRNTAEDLCKRKFFPGNMLRATSLDELPQLWNVLKGEMSLIGPRPLPIAYLPLFSMEQRLRHSVRPGITGWAQVNGRHEIPWPEKLKLDTYYVRNVSFRMDVKIFIRTIQLLASFRRDVSLAEQPFTGQQ